MRMGWTFSLAAALTACALPGNARLDAQQATSRTVVLSPRGQGWIGIDAQFYDTWRLGGQRSAPVMVVMGVYPESPAARAGLQSGDTILRLNGAPAVPEALERFLSRLEPGNRVNVTLRRSGRELTVPLQAADRPSGDLRVTLPQPLQLRIDSIQALFIQYLDSTSRMAELGFGPQEEPTRIVLFRAPERVDESVAKSLPSVEVATVRASQQRATAEAELVRRRREVEALVRSAPAAMGASEVERVRPLAPYIMGQDWIAGARLTSLNAGLSGYFGVERGLLVVEVAPGTLADDAGVSSGDVILQAGGRAVTSLEELRAALAASRGPALMLTVVRKGRPVQLSLRP
jgi:predicted metalloprotease with PDZ domain